MIKINIGLIGAGTIGRFLLEKVNKEGLFTDFRITSVFDDRSGSNSKLTSLAVEYNFKIYNEMDAFLASNLDVIVECANIDIVKQYACRIVQEKDLLLISVGALADRKLYDELKRITKETGKKVYLPSGAIGGLDVLRAANVLEGLESVMLVSRKPAQALSERIIIEETILFEGSAKNAIQNYPKNANVAIILSLAGIGIDKTKVRIIADPMIDNNIHTIEASGDFGKFKITLENDPSPSNPKTSYLTALSVLSSLTSLNRAMSIR